MVTRSVVALALAIVAGSARAEPGEAHQLVPVGVRASSALPDWKGYTFGAENLIDGKVDTSWQPVRTDALGVGQWLELDLGRAYEVTAVEVANGLQKVTDDLGDLFCRNTRPARLSLYFDDGSVRELSAGPADKVVRLAIGDASIVTRYIRIVVSEVFLPVDWKDMAIAEVRAFGRPSRAPAPAPGVDVECGSEAWAPFLKAVLDACAGSTELRLQRNCVSLVHSMVHCPAPHQYPGNDYEPTPKVSAADASGTRVDYNIAAEGWIEHALKFERPSPRAPWKLTGHTCNNTDVTTGTKETGFHCGETLEPKPSTAPNPCWEQLGKKPPR